MRCRWLLLVFAVAALAATDAVSVPVVGRVHAPATARFARLAAVASSVVESFAAARAHTEEQQGTGADAVSLVELDEGMVRLNVTAFPNMRSVRTCLLARRSLLLSLLGLVFYVLARYWRVERLEVQRKEIRHRQRHRKPAVYDDFKYRTLDLLTSFQTSWRDMCEFFAFTALLVLVGGCIHGDPSLGDVLAGRLGPSSPALSALLSTAPPSSPSTPTSP